MRACFNGGRRCLAQALASGRTSVGASRRVMRVAGSGGCTAAKRALRAGRGLLEVTKTRGVPLACQSRSAVGRLAVTLGRMTRRGGEVQTQAAAMEHADTLPLAELFSSPGVSSEVELPAEAEVPIEAIAPIEAEAPVGDEADMIQAEEEPNQAEFLSEEVPLPGLFVGGEEVLVEAGLATVEEPNQAEVFSEAELPVGDEAEMIELEEPNQAEFLSEEVLFAGEEFLVEAELPPVVEPNWAEVLSEAEVRHEEDGYLVESELPLAEEPNQAEVLSEAEVHVEGDECNYLDESELPPAEAEWPVEAEAAEEYEVTW